MNATFARQMLFSNDINFSIKFPATLFKLPYHNENTIFFNYSTTKK